MEKPIPLNGEMVRAVLDGRKTMTRRPIKPQPDSSSLKHGHSLVPLPYKQTNINNKRISDVGFFCSKDGEVDKSMPAFAYKSPYQIGDKLWVQEGYQITNVSGSDESVNGFYLSDNAAFINIFLSTKELNLFCSRKFPFHPTAGRFMYKSLARIWLEVTNVRVERVQEITPQDCLAEGISYEQHAQGLGDACDEIRMIQAFQELWNSIYEKRGYGWDENCWVWVFEFRRIED